MSVAADFFRKPLKFDADIVSSRTNYCDKAHSNSFVGHFYLPAAILRLDKKLRDKYDELEGYKDVVSFREALSERRRQIAETVQLLEVVAAGGAVLSGRF